jgi:hypothetical protein
MAFLSVSLIHYNFSKKGLFREWCSRKPHDESAAIPEEEEHATTAPGDVWLMGEYRLLCGDATSIDAIRTV